MFGARDAPRPVLAGDEPSLPVARVAVGEVGGLAEDADRAGFLVPTHDPLVGDVAPEKRARVAQPHGSFAPAKAGGQPLDPRGLDAVALEALVEDFDRRIGIAAR